MPTRNRRKDWLDEDEYPDDRDVDEFGDDSPIDYDRMTIGKVRGVNTQFWTRSRIIFAVVAVILLGSMVVGWVLSLRVPY